MRVTRALAAAAAIVAAMPRVGTAQLGSSFKDAWFWGVKAGGMDFNSGTTPHRQAPLGGIEWLITRSHGGLYLSYSEAFFTDQAAILTNLSPSDTTPHIINLKNMRRLDVAAMIFPGNNLYVHPYAGIGFSVKQISSAAAADNNYSSVDEYNATQAYITQLRTGASPYFVAGSQLRLIGFSVFFQGTASPAQKDMFLYNGKAFHLTYEAGIRYNFGSSISKDE
jgi:hypothetical protein